MWKSSGFGCVETEKAAEFQPLVLCSQVQDINLKVNYRHIGLSPALSGQVFARHPATQHEEYRADRRLDTGAGGCVPEGDWGDISSAFLLNLVDML